MNGGRIFMNFISLQLTNWKAFDYEVYKKNGFQVEHLGDYPLKLETKPE